ncbi:atg4 [Symbiodinium natans]|uniref:Atg4 protein n=1 Tax=Symbiodinium natans TaxID=878477 RepID=A0A812URI8_9DINO|nr:atg4 [Symbiodinium natans]
MKQRGSKTNWDFQQEKHFGDGFKALKREAMLPARLHRMIDELRKWMPFTPSARVVCFGITYDASDEAQREAFMEDFRSRILLTYRSGLEPPLELAGGGTKSSDSGWGCMLRVTQMMLAQCFVTLSLGRAWRFSEAEDLAEGSLYLRIVSCFLDTPAAPFSLHRLVETGQQVLGKEPSTWFGPTSAAQAVGHLFQDLKSKASGAPEFLRGVDCAVFVDGPIYKTNVIELFDGGSSAVILFVCRRLGLEEFNLEEYREGLESCFQLPEFQGLASGNSSSSAHFFVATHGEDSMLFLDPHTTSPALRVEGDVVAAHGLRPERALRLPWSNLNPSICVAFLVRSKVELLPQCLHVGHPIDDLQIWAQEQHVRFASSCTALRLDNAEPIASFSETDICANFHAADAHGMRHVANEATLASWIRAGIQVPHEWMPNDLVWEEMLKSFKSGDPEGRDRLMKYNSFRAQFVADLLCFTAMHACPQCSASAMGSTKPSSDLDVSVTAAKTTANSGPDVLVKRFNEEFASAWGLAQDGLGMTSAEKFDTNIYGFAWFEATPGTYDSGTTSAEPGELQKPCHAVQEYTGVRDPNNISSWRLRRFSAADNPHSGDGIGAQDTEDQHSFGMAKLLYYLREYGREGGIAACSTASAEEADIATTLDDGTNFTGIGGCGGELVCTPICEFWHQLRRAIILQEMTPLYSKIQALTRAARDIMSNLLASHAKRARELLPGKEVSSRLWQDQIMVRNMMYAEKLSRVYALERQLTRSGPRAERLSQCAQLRRSITESLAYGIETYWTQGAFDSVVGRLQLNLLQPCVNGSSCELQISKAGFLDSLLENLADIFKELSHNHKEFKDAEDKARHFFPDLSSKELARKLDIVCRQPEMCEAATTGQCDDSQLCSLCVAWPSRDDSSETECVPRTSIPFFHFLVEGSKYMSRAWQMIRFSGTRVPNNDNVREKDEVAESAAYMAACTTAYANELQADWRGTGRQVPLDVLRGRLLCWGTGWVQDFNGLARDMKAEFFDLGIAPALCRIEKKRFGSPREQVFEVLERQPTYCGSLDEITEQDDLARHGTTEGCSEDGKEGGGSDVGGKWEQWRSRAWGQQHSCDMKVCIENVCVFAGRAGCVKRVSLPSVDLKVSTIRVSSLVLYRHVWAQRQADSVDESLSDTLGETVALSWTWLMTADNNTVQNAIVVFQGDGVHCTGYQKPEQLGIKAFASFISLVFIHHPPVHFPSTLTLIFDCMRNLTRQEGFLVTLPASHEFSSCCLNAAFAWIKCNELQVQELAAGDGLFGGYAEMPRKDSFSFNAAIAACATMRQWSLSAWLFGAAKAARALPNTVSLNVVLQACSSNSWRFSLGWLQAGYAMKMQPDTITYTLTAQAAGPYQPNRGLDLLASASARRVVLKQVAVGAAVAATRSWWRWALTTLSACNDLGLRAGVTAYNAALASRLLSWKRALSLLRHTAREVRRDTISFNSAASLASETHSWASAFTLLAEAVAAAVQQDVISCDALLGAASKSRVWEEPVQLLADFRSRELRSDAALHSRSLPKDTMGSHWQLSLHGLQEVTQTALMPDEISYASALEVFADAWAEAMLLLMGPNSRRSAHAYATLLTACRSDWQCALQVLGAAKRDCMLDAFFVNALIDVCAKEWQWQHAWALLNRLSVQRLQKNIVSFNAVLDAVRNARAWRPALEIQSLLAAAALEADIVSHVSALHTFYLASQWQVLLASHVPGPDGAAAEVVGLRLEAVRTGRLHAESARLLEELEQTSAAWLCRRSGGRTAI